MQQPRLTCSIVISTRHRPETLARCLENVKAQVGNDAELIVADNSPGDDAVREVAAGHGARCITVPEQGLARARNAGARAATGEIVAFIDDDVQVADNWLPALLAPFEDPAVMAAAGRIVPLDTSEPAQQLYATAAGLDLGERPRSLDRTGPLWFEVVNFASLGGGANLAIRREVFDLWPGFRESLGLGAAIPGGEEQYAFFQLAQRGWRIVYAPDAVVAHPYPSTVEELRVALARRLVGAAGYATLLFVEEPGCRMRVLRYALQALTGRPRAWRESAPWQGVRILSRVQTSRALIEGVLAYARWRLSDRPDSSARESSAANRSGI